MVIGVSGGLDSTHALIVAAKVCDRLGLPRTTILGFTMPGFATSEATKSQRLDADAARSASPAEEIDIRPAARQMLARHRPPLRARASRSTTSPSRTCRRACAPTTSSGSPTSDGGFVIGTGDLSELALGWCTYGVGDQMSHYAVNAGRAEDADPVPDPLGGRAPTSSTAATDAVLEAILGTEISPELVPADAERRDPEHRGEDRALRAATTSSCYHIMRYGLPPSKVAFLAWHAWRDAGRGALADRTFPRRRGTPTTSRRSASGSRAFLWRFFAISQFKRSAIPNGPKVSSGGALSPRGDWRAPSDATAAPWLEELRRNVPEG